MDIKKQIGLRLIELRKAEGLSQEKLALNCEIDRTYIQSIEKGKRNISVEMLFKICKGLDISIVEFLKDIENGI